MFPDLDTTFPYLDTSTDNAPQQVEALGHVAPHEPPDPPVRVPLAAGGLDPPLQVPLPQADPQSHLPGRGDGGPAARLPRSVGLRPSCQRAARRARGPRGSSRAPLHDQLHRLQVLAGVLVVAVPDAEETRSMTGQQPLGSPLARFQRSQRAHTFPQG